MVKVAPRLREEARALLDQELCGYWALTRASQRGDLSFGQHARSKCA